ncbi:MAG: hypothetical protein DMF68_11450 [Acidobacteria bacterium]|nr:MAG: hypothetical protein DMF68_11450 [Acidobacteriota bacterium]
MSYHILHQFDEQWLADLRAREGKDKGKSFLSSFDNVGERKRRARFGSRESHYWGVIAAAILMATFALLFALDASRRAEVLQQRLDAVEKTVKSK